MNDTTTQATMNIPVCCATCMYCLTHERCHDCFSASDDGRGRRYANWREGIGLLRLEKLEKEGKRNIVIGGQGEAEVNVRWSPERASKHLHRVAAQCGYMCGKLVRQGSKAKLSIVTREGTFLLEWESDRLVRIKDETGCRNNPARKPKRFWPIIEESYEAQARKEIRHEN